MAERYDRDLTDLFELQDVDRQSIADFEVDLSNNLYKLWNRLSAGSYFPPPVRRVDIPKADGGTRPLGIPTVADRIAQEVAPVDRLVQGMPPSDRYRFRRDGSSVWNARSRRGALPIASGVHATRLLSLLAVVVERAEQRPVDVGGVP